jgi:hypothetical protein
LTDYEKELKAGVGAALAAETYLAWSADPTHVFPPGTVALYDGIVPSNTDTAIAMNTYTVQMTPAAIIGLQFHAVSTDPDELTRALQAINDALDGRWGGTLGLVRLVSAAHQSSGLLGQDANGRRGRTENYYLTINRTIPNRTGA